MPDAASNDASPTSRRSSARTPPAAPATPVRSESGLGLAGWIVVGMVLVLGALVFDSLYALLDHVHYADMVAALQATPR
ncbi:MAG: hypothetical protein I4O48_00525, partial [Ralstonia sp.]|nr:hypothetical protein [Ralstonia sp.]